MSTLDLMFDVADVKSNIKDIYNGYRSGKNIETLLDYYLDINYDIFFGSIKPQTVIYKMLEKYYRNEYFVKRDFVINHLFNSNDIYFEELKLGDVRADLIGVGENSTAYEIKTKYDNTNRILKQTDEYLKCFEYVYVICFEDMLEEIEKIINKDCGIYIYKNQSHKFTRVRKAKKSKTLNKISILNVMTKKDRITYFENSLISSIDKNYNLKEINSAFKMMLKEKHSNDYAKLKKECDDISRFDCTF